MLWTTWVVPVLCLLAAVPADSARAPLLFPGPSACTAPSGRPGDCVLPQDCPEERKPFSKTACGYSPAYNNALLYCCERRPTTPTPTDAGPPRTLPTKCGLSYGQPGALGNAPLTVHRNVAFGVTAQEHAWPWAAVIGHQSPNSKIEWQCGGVLLSAQHVLTAAHCLPPDGSSSKMIVRLGEYDLAAPTNLWRQDRGVRHLVRHQNYSRSQNDMALLTLDAPVRLDLSAQPICLPKPEVSLVGRIGYVVGWGKLEHNSPRLQLPTLQEALLMVANATECEQKYSRTRDYQSRFPAGFGDRVLCASDPSPRTVEGGLLVAGDACRGDSGGPLSIQLRSGRYVLSGLVLEGMGCGSTEYHGLYTRVGSYVDWIRREVARS